LGDSHSWSAGGRIFGNTFHFTTRYLFEFIGAEAGLLNPVFFVGMIWASVAFWRKKPRDLRMIYFFQHAVPVVFAYLLQSLHARVLPNWIVPAIIPSMFMMVIYWDQYRQLPWVRRTFAPD